MPNATFRFFVEKLGNSTASNFIGDAGEIFYDPGLGILRLSDGSTPGGIPITTGTGGSFDPTQYYTRAAVDGLLAGIVGTANTQGDTLGELQDKFSSYIPLTGGTLTGPLYYSTLPTGATELTNKNYVDQKINTSLATALAGLNTSQVSEGTNLYFTDARVTSTLANATNTPGLVRSVNGSTPDALGAVTIAGMVKTVNGTTADANGEVTLTGLVETVDGNGPDVNGNIALTGFVRSVNGISPDTSGNVPISITAVETGDLNSRPLSANAGVIYVVSNDADPNNDGKTFIYEEDTASWYQIATSDMASNDARYVNTAGDTMTGPLSLSGNPTANLHSATKEYVDTALATLTLDNLFDVSTAGATAGQVVAYNGTSWTAANIAARLDDLLDVNSASASNGQVLTFSSNTWVAANVISKLDELSDVVSANAVVGQSLVYDGTNWVPATPAAKLGDLLDVSNTAPTTGQVLAWDSANSEWKPIASAAAPTLASLLDVDVTGLANTSTLQYSSIASKWKVATPQPKKVTMLPDHGIGWGRSHIYGNEVFCAGFSGDSRIHAWDHSGDVVVSLSAPFEIRPPGITKLVEGISYQHVIGTDGILYSRGRDSEGQMGTGGSPGRPIDDRGSIFRQNRDPKVYGPGITVTNVWSHRKYHWDGADGGCLFVEVDDNGTKKIYAAGYNGFGQLGIGGTTNTNALTELVLLRGKGIKKVDNFSHITMFVTNNGELWGAGYNSNGAMGIDFIGQSALAQSKFSDGTLVSGAVDVQVSWVNSVGTQSWFLRNDGTVWGSGSNGESNLCNGATGDVTKYKQVLTAANTPITGVTKILEVGRGQLFMLKSDGTVWATGRNHDSCFGNSAFPAYTNIGVFAKQIQSDIQDFWAFGGEINGWCTVYWKKNNKMFFSGTNYNYTGGSFTDAIGAGYYNFLQPIESLDGKTIIDIKPINKINSDGSGAYRNPMFLTDEGEIYLAGRNDWCHVPDDGDAIYFKTTYKLRDYLEGAEESVYVTRYEASTLDQLSDVSIIAPTVGSKLQWDGFNWVAARDNAAVTGSAPLYYEAGLGDAQEALNGLGFTLTGEATKQQNVAGNFNSAGIRLIDTTGANGNGVVSWNPNIDWTKNVRISFRIFVPNSGTVDDIIVGMAGNLDGSQSIEMSIDPYTGSYKVRKNGTNLTTVTWANAPAGNPTGTWNRFFTEIVTINGKRILKLVRWVGGEPQIAAAGDVTGFGTAFGGLYFRAWNGSAIPSSAVLLQSCQVEYI